MKKVISCLIAISLVLSMCMSAFAVSSEPSMDEYQTLNAAVRAAQTDEEATKAMNDLLDFFERLEVFKKSGITPRATDLNPSVIDSYIDMTSCSVSAGKATFNYKLVALVPSGASLTLGYVYPEGARIPEGSFNPGSTLGTYSKTIDTGNCASEIQLVGKFLARDFRATKIFKQTYQYGFSGTQYAYKTITSQDVASNKILLGIAGVVGMLTLKSDIGEYVVKFAGMVGLVSVFDEMPSLQVGQYYVTKTWFSNGRMYTNLRIWTSENAYGKNEETLYDKTTSVALLKF